MLFNHGLSPAYAKATAGRRTALTNVRAGRAWTPAAPHWLVTVCSSFALAITSFAADPAITVSAQQRYPWNGLVDINFTITGTSGTKYDTSFTAKDMVGNTNIAMQTIRKSDGTAAAATEQLIPGTYNWVWDAAADLPKDFKCDHVTVTGTADISAFPYSVKFNANGGSGTMANESFTYGTAKALTANAFTRTGYAFQGWATSASGAKAYNDKQSVSNLTATAGGTVNLYAVWKGNSYSVKFNANGGTGTMSNESFTYGTAKALTANAFTRTGYTFQGWATSASGSKVYNDKQSVSNLTTTAGATVNLYAKWSGISYSVKFNANGGTGTMANESFTYGTAKALTANAFTRTGYAFQGWATSASGAKVYNDKQVVSNLTTTVGAVVSLYAVWGGHGKVQLWAGGPYWATTNIGADNPEDYGYYFWWGDTVGYKREGNAWVATDGSSSNFAFDLENSPTYNKSGETLQSEGWITEDNVLSPEHDAAQVQWGGGWRMPTQRELYDLNETYCDWTWTSRNGINGYEVRGRGDYASSSIFLPCTGYGYGTSITSTDSGCYWSSGLGAVWNASWGLSFNSANPYSYMYNSHYHGQAIRPVHSFSN